MMKNKILKIIPLGGVGEIGKNMLLYEYDDNILVVDAGLMFPENDMLGIDYIIPNFQYLIDRREMVRGIIITHGHEDHTGSIHHVMDQINAPIYATRLTQGLLEVKLSRAGLLQKTKFITVKPGDHLKIDPFEIEFFHVCHSIPGGVGLGINTPQGLIVQSGDYKFDNTPVDNQPTDYAKLAEFASRGVLALLADSTNADEPGWTPSERVIDKALAEVFRHTHGRIIVASFASLISRIQQVANVSKSFNRKIVFVGTSMRENTKMARKLDYLDIPEEMMVTIEQALTMPDEKVVIMCTGSQGEPTSILGRLSRGTNRPFELKKGDTVILSSHPIPGNEENVYRTINRLFRRGARVIYDPIEQVHVSGHASQEEMKLMLHLVNPRFLIPIHGELRHLYQHARIAEEIGIPSENILVVENGQVIQVNNGSLTLGERLPGGYVFVDGTSVGEIGPSVVREREKISRDGFILVNLAIDPKSQLFLTDPEIITRGFIYSQDSDALMSALRDHIRKFLDENDSDVKTQLTNDLKSFLYKETKRRPMIFVTTTQV